MPTNLSIVVNRLRPFLGDFAEEYAALELSLVNTQYLDVRLCCDGLRVSFPGQLPNIATRDMVSLLRNLHDSLKIIIGPAQTTFCIERIQFDLFDELLNRSSRMGGGSETAVNVNMNMNT